MKDGMIRATAAGGSLRLFVADATQTVNEAFHIHQTSPVVTAALGRLLTAAAMMGAMLKNETDIVTLTVKGNGPLGGVMVTSDSLSRVKGYPFNPRVDIPLKPNGKLDVSGAVGVGVLQVAKDVGLKEPYTGQIELVSGEIAEDLAQYFALSEQTPTAVALGVLVDVDYQVKQAGGYMVQALPGASDDTLAALEGRLAKLPPVTQLMEEGRSPQDILALITEGMDCVVNDTIPIGYYCNCNRDRVEKALVSLGRKELEMILAEDKLATLHCHFCNTDYHFDEAQLRAILEPV